MLAIAIANCSVMNLSAQGNTMGMGNENEQIQSLSERILKLEKKSDAINVYLNLKSSYEERFNGDDKGGSFVGNQLRFEMQGNLNEHWSYRLRYRLNRPGEQQSDNFSNNIDIMMAQYKFNDRWSVAGGKLGVAFGGYQYDANPIDVLEFCDFLCGIDGFHVGAHVSYAANKNNTFTLGVYNVNNDNSKKYYSEEPNLKQAKHPLGASLHWAGNLFDGKLQTLWSYSLGQEASKSYSNFVMLGTKLNLKKWQFIIDYYGGWEQLDHNKTVSADMSAALGQTVLARNTSYNTVLGEIHYQPTPHWNCMLVGGIESASANDVSDFHNYRKSYCYQAAVQWIPDLTQNARLSLAYIGKKVDYTSRCGLEDYNRDRVELSLIYRIKAY